MVDRLLNYFFVAMFAFSVGLGAATIRFQRTMPSVVIVKGKTFTLNYTKTPGGDTNGQFAGYTRCIDHAIDIDPTQHTYDQRDILIHELLHAETCAVDGSVDNYYYNTANPETHTGIYHISDAVLDLLSNNPELVKYLEKPK